MESFGGTLAKPLTPTVREGSEFELLVWAPSLPQVLGLRLAKNDDLGDWVFVGLFAGGEKKQPRTDQDTVSVNEVCKMPFWAKGSN